MKNKQINKNPNRKLTALQVHLPWIWGEQESTNKKKKKRKRKRLPWELIIINPHLWRLMASIHTPNLKWFQSCTIPMFMGESTFLIKEWTPHIPNSTNEFKTNKKLPQEVYIETTN